MPKRLVVNLQPKLEGWQNWAARYEWLLPLSLAFIVNANVLLNGFVWDDAIIFSAHSHQAQKMVAPALTPDVYYRPLIVWSYRLDQWIWGLNPFGFHLSVYLSHALTTLFVYLCVVSLQRLYTKESGVALITASLFAVHPIHAEAVAWISGRNDVFMALFLMTALYAYLRYRLQPSFWVMLPLFALGSILGLLSKETAIPFLMIFPVLDFLFHRSGVIRWAGMKDPFTWVWVLGSGAFMFYRLTQVGMPPALNGGIVLNGHAITTAFTALGYYLRLLFIPYPLNLFVTELPIWNAQGFLHLLTGVSGLMALLWIIFRWNRTLFSVGAVWFVLGIAVPLVVPFVKVSVTPVAERYVYLASGGFLLLVTVGIVEGWRWILARLHPSTNPQWGLGCLAIIIALFSLLTMERNGVWRDELTVWEDAVRKSPDAVLPHSNLGDALANQGRLAEAVRNYQTALKLKPDYIEAHNNLGNAYAAQGRLDEAIQEFQNALALQPDSAIIHYNLGDVYEKQGRFDEAIQEYRAGLKINPDDAVVRKRLANILSRIGRPGEAEKENQFASTLQPIAQPTQTDSARAHYNKGTKLAEQGRLDEAIREFQAALHLNPNYQTEPKLSKRALQLGPGLCQRGEI